MHNTLQKKYFLALFLTSISFLQASDSAPFSQMLGEIRTFLSAGKSPKETKSIEEEYSYQKCGGYCMIGRTTDDAKNIIGCYVIKKLPKAPLLFCIKTIKAPNNAILDTIWRNIFASLDALPEDQKCTILLIAVKRDLELIKMLKNYGFKTDVLRTEQFRNHNPDQKATNIMTIDFSKIPSPMPLD